MFPNEGATSHSISMSDLSFDRNAPVCNFEHTAVILRCYVGCSIAAMVEPGRRCTSGVNEDEHRGNRESGKCNASEGPGVRCRTCFAGASLGCSRCRQNCQEEKKAQSASRHAEKIQHRRLDTSSLKLSNFEQFVGPRTGIIKSRGSHPVTWALDFFSAECRASAF